MKHEAVINRVTSNDLSNIKVGVKKTFENVYHYADFALDDLINKRALQEFSPEPPEDSIINIPIGTASPFVVDYTIYAEHGNNPTKWVDLYRSESPVITEQQYLPIICTYTAGTLVSISIDFGGTTVDRYRLVIKG